jgi:branched-chain amino acid transport system permease protein
MPPSVFTSFGLYASMMILLSIGFTLTHMMERFPNFAHTSYATIGTAVVFTFTRILGFNPYLSWPFAAILSGLVGIVLFILVVRPLQQLGASMIKLTFVMITLSYLINSTLAMFSFWVLRTFRFRTASFMLRGYDFQFLGLPGITFVAPITSLVLVIVLHFFLTRTRFGIAMRATVENPTLASSLGVNIFHVHLASWFLTGALAGIAGAAIPMWQPTSVSGSDPLMMTVIAGSVLGGLDDIYGAIIGGFTLAFSQVILPSLFIRFLGIWVAGYTSLFPMIIIFSILWFKPEGITSFFKT